MKNYLGCRKGLLIILLLFLVSVLSVSGCSEKGDNQQQVDRQKEAQERRVQILNDFAISYNAIPYNSTPRDFTVQVEKDFMVGENKALAVYAELTDVRRLNSNYYIVADYDYFPVVKLVLSCDQNLAEQALQEYSKYLENGADSVDVLLAIKIDGVKKVDFGLNLDYDSQAAQIYVDSDEEAFIAHGSCLGVLVKPTN